MNSNLQNLKTSFKRCALWNFFKWNKWVIDRSKFFCSNDKLYDVTNIFSRLWKLTESQENSIIKTNEQNLLVILGNVIKPPHKYFLLINRFYLHKEQKYVCGLLSSHFIKQDLFPFL